jgi:GNAT superfamily N-acetyltransferase
VETAAPASIRTQLRPGDLGAVAALHGREYSDEYGLDELFEAHVARGLSDFALELAREPEAGRLWLAEDGDELMGCIAITRVSADHGRLRWFLVSRRARGQGLGRRLLGEALAYARGRFASLELETFSELTTAARLYREAGFVVRDAAPQADWGREIELQHYVLHLR